MDCDEIETEATKNIKEKSADEMFSELGYIRIANNQFCITYQIRDDRRIPYTIQFGFDKNTVEKYYYNEILNFINAERITMQELKAINKKCEDLGWI